MGKVYVNECSNSSAAQTWNVMADGRIALEANSSTCNMPFK